MKYLIAGLTLLASMSMSSCKQDFECNCVEKFNGVETNLNSKHVGFDARDESEAVVRCATYETTHYVDTVVVTFECELN